MVVGVKVDFYKDMQFYSHVIHLVSRVSGELDEHADHIKEVYDRASSQDKRYHIVEGANHMDLYDGKAYVAEAISVLAPFFEETL